MGEYSAMAQCYDALSEAKDISRRSEYICGLLGAASQAGIILDAGCGTGELSVRLCRRGYDMIGVDASAEMLSAARAKAAAAGCDILFLQQSLQQLDLYGTVRAVLCTQDTLNHIINKAELRRALEKMSLFTEPGGKLIFDVNTPYKHRTALNSRCYSGEFAGGMCVWQSELRADGYTVDIDVDVFLRSGEYYRRESERIVERAYEPAELEKLLTRCGYTVDKIIDGESYGAVRADSQRLLYSCTKI